MSQIEVLDSEDELYAKAIELVVTKNKVSTSFVQRELKIGYNRAANFIEDMEKNGIVSAANELGKRTVLEKGKKVIEMVNKVHEIGRANGMSREITDKVNADISHNSGDTQDVGCVAGKRLLAFLERVERLEEEKAALMEDIKEVYAEAKGVGFDVKTLRKLVKLRKVDTEKRSEEQALLELYASAVGMQGVLL